MTGNIQVATTVLGGLALFIYGMWLMSEGLMQVVGARMKAILGYVTKNRVAAIAAGAGIAALAHALPEMLHCVNDAERISDIALKIFRKASRVQREGLSDEVLQLTNDLMGEIRSLAAGTVLALKSGESPAIDPDAVEKRIVEMARDLTRRFAHRLKETSGDAPHDMAFLTVMSAVKDVARHLKNIAERIEAEQI